MNSYERFYREKLYPFQDGVLSIVRELNTPFYLTGGTALSRYYFDHRFSDDLDFFVNAEGDYDLYVENIYKTLVDLERDGKLRLDYSRLSKSKDSARFILISNDLSISLQVDLVNDISKHYGDFETDDKIGKIDSWRNILSNKISAIFRYEPKDIADIWIISKRRNFNWQEIILEAKTKEVGVDPIIIYEILMSVNMDLIDSIKWSVNIKEYNFMDDISLIAKDIFHGNKNSICDENS